MSWSGFGGRSTTSHSQSSDRSLDRNYTTKSFSQNCPEPSVNEYEYQKVRNQIYKQKNGKPVSSGFPDDISRRDYASYKQREPLDNDARKWYRENSEQARASIASRDNEEREYYDDINAGYTPRQHRELAPLARRHEETAFDHAHSRRKALDASPYMYKDSQGQLEHWGYAKKAYTKSDEARENLRVHRQHACEDSDRDDGKRDVYGEKVPRGWQPSPHPYPGTKPGLREYAARRGMATEEFAWKTTKGNKRGKGGSH